MVTKKRVLFVGLLLASFLVGAYYWKINHTGAFFWRAEEHPASAEDLDFTVYVGDYLITREEVEWEYQMYMAQLSAPEVGSQSESRPLEGDQQNPKPNVDNLKSKINIELYNKILADLIERKLLYQHVSNDVKFNLTDVSRYTGCMQEFVEAGSRLPNLVRDEKTKEHLKSMLCEKSILDQYVKERVNTGSGPGDEQIRAYYNANRSKMVEPQRVVIRQIVLGSEDDAKSLRDRVNPGNFAQMAREHSISPEAKTGGLLGPFAKGDLPSVFDVAFEMKPGTIQGILKSTYGFHIVMLERKLPRVDLSYEAAKPKITKELA
ncbi:MAG: hypothetical protein EOP10_03570, partial [Proteobacteria bacterium]